MLILRQLHNAGRNFASFHKFGVGKGSAQCLIRQNTNTRSLSLLRFRRFNEAYYLKKDKIPQGYQIIYKAPMEMYFSVSKNLTTATVLVIGIAALSEYGNMSKFINVPVTIDVGGLVSDTSDLLYFLAGFTIITVALRIMISRYPLRIYRNENKYVAVFEGQLPFVYGKLHFLKGEVVEMPPKGLFPWRDSMFKIRNSKVFMLVDHFKTPSELNSMLKPLC